MPKISELPVAAGVSPADEIPLNSTGAIPVTTRRVTVAQLDARPFVSFADLVAGANDDVNFTLLGEQRAVRLVAGPDAAFSITGIVAPAIDGRVLALLNLTGEQMTIANDTASAAANRILTLTGGDLVFPGPAVVQLVYDSAEVRWLVIGTHPQP